MADNTVTLVGNCTKDPELKYTTGGRGVASFGLAVNRKWKNRQTGEWEEQVSFFNITAWAELGENAAATLQKGNRVIVVGRLDQRSYETREGEKRSVTEIVADSIGPDLRWATAQVERTERTTGNQAPQGRTQPEEEPF